MIKNDSLLEDRLEKTFSLICMSTNNWYLLPSSIHWSTAFNIKFKLLKATNWIDILDLSQSLVGSGWAILKIMTPVLEKFSGFGKMLPQKVCYSRERMIVLNGILYWKLPCMRDFFYHQQLLSYCYLNVTWQVLSCNFHSLTDPSS